MFAIDTLLETGLKILDKVIPDPEAKAKAQLDLLRLQQEGEFKELEMRMNAILAEAQSQDKWTSRARPSFMYVFYVLILWSIVMGFLYVISPETAANFTIGFKQWLGAIPSDLYMLFGMGYLGYTSARSYDKSQILKGKK